MNLLEADKKHVRIGIAVDSTNYKTIVTPRWWRSFEELSKKHPQLFYFPTLWEEFSEIPFQRKSKITIDLTAPMQ